MKRRAFKLKIFRLGPLPLINHFIDRLDLEDILERFIPTTDSRTRITYARRLGVLMRSVATEREPIYRLGEVVEAFAPEGFGLKSGEVERLTDDAVGRALDKLFDADRGALMTEIVIRTRERFGLCMDEVNNDSTTVKLTGQYKQAKGRSIRGKKAPFVTYGFSKDRRPDLKQLLFILTTTKDGAVPVQFRCEAGNTSDSRTHEETWEALKAVTGTSDFLYVADSKLCSADAMEYIARHSGRFVCVLPKNRLEDKEFRAWIQTNEPEWEKVWDRQNPRGKGLPRDRWYAVKHRLPSGEGWPLIWVFSSLLRLKHTKSRQERIACACQELSDLAAHHQGPRPRKRSRYEIRRQIDQIIERYRVKRYLKVSLKSVPKHTYKQERPGRPGPDTRYVKKTKKRWRIEWTVDEAAIAYDHVSDGMYPLITNDRNLAPRQVLEAHKRQPQLEKRFSQIKSVIQIAPVWLKNEGRVEALFFVYFLALLVLALMERGLRRAMEKGGIADIPLYPEERSTSRPTSQQILRIFSFTERHVLLENGRGVQEFAPKLTDLQKQVLGLMGVPLEIYLGR